jgi:hypothetical protein
MLYRKKSTKRLFRTFQQTLTDQGYTVIGDDDLEIKFLDWLQLHNADGLHRVAECLLNHPKLALRSLRVIVTAAAIYQ